MRIAICVKQVPASSYVKIDEKTKQLKREDTAGMLNPSDSYALELALQMKDAYGASITAFTMGPPAAKAVLKQCYSLGADEAYLLSDKAFAGSDTYATAYILAHAIRTAEAQNEPFDLVFCGKQSSDGDTAQVGPELAEQLGIAQITAICDCPVLKDGTILALQERNDTLAQFKIQLPALITVGKTPYELRYATISGVINSNHTDAIRTLTMADLPQIDPQLIGLDGSPTRTIDTYEPPKRTDTAWIEGNTPHETASLLAKQLTKLGLV